MYLNILKKDLKRKRTMNVIVLMFIIISAMFLSGSVNNIIAVFKGLDSYFEKAGMPDYFLATLDRGHPEEIYESLDAIEEIDSYGLEPVIYISSDNVSNIGKELPEINGTLVFMAYEDAKITYFDENNEPINSVKKGTIRLSAKSMNKNKLKTGDRIAITFGNDTEEFEIAGGIKDAFLGADMISMTRFMVCREDFDNFYMSQETSKYCGNLCYIETNDIDAVEKSLSEVDTVFNGSRDLIKKTYFLDMVMAGTILVVSVLLIITAFIVLRFTIGFTLSEEYREIGVMKAIGIKNSKIRLFYIIKYLALALIGTFVGFFTSIPFGKMLLKSATKSIVLENENSVIINLICSAAIVGIIVLFCYGCTRKVVKLLPVDAVRNGQTGERFRKKSIIHLGKSRLSPCSFMSINDIFSSPKRYVIIVLIIFLCLSPLLIVANTANTLKSDKLVTSLGVTKTDVYISDEGKQMSFMHDNGAEEITEYLNTMEQMLADRGIPAKASCEIMMKLTASHGNKSFKSMTLKGFNTTTDMYPYKYGTPPQNENEVAITPIVAEKLDAEIGDTIKIKFIEGEKEFTVTAFYTSMNNVGEGIRLHESLDVNFRQLAGFLAFQADYTDNPDKSEQERRIGVIREIYGKDNVFSAEEYVEKMTGVKGAFDSIRIIILLLVLIVAALVAVLMERSFIEKEHGEIAVMKAIGFKSGNIIAYHTFRMGIVAAIAVILSAVLSTSITKLSVNPIFKMLGDVYGVEYEIKPLEIFAAYPAAVFAAVIFFTFISALRIKRIHTSEVSSIE